MSQQQAQQYAIQQQQQQLAMQQQQQLAMQQQQQGYQPPPQQHMQQPPQHMQQVPPQHMQQGQVPPQHMQQGQIPPQHMQQNPGQHGRPPPPPGPHRGHPGQGQQVYNAQQMANERDHIAEHVGAPVDTSKMSEQELQFHYFKMHDSDNNNKLDGCELVKSLIHWHGTDQANHDPKAQVPLPDPKIFTDEELLAMIDPILDQDDKNKDGFIDYPEFIQAQQASSSPPEN